jgi:hypothetical protein
MYNDALSHKEAITKVWRRWSQSERHSNFRQTTIREEIQMCNGFDRCLISTLYMIISFLCFAFATRATLESAHRARLLDRQERSGSFSSNLGNTPLQEWRRENVSPESDF